jgi:hypothetical protein
MHFGELGIDILHRCVVIVDAEGEVISGCG